MLTSSEISSAAAGGLRIAVRRRRPRRWSVVASVVVRITLMLCAVLIVRRLIVVDRLTVEAAGLLLRWSPILIRAMAAILLSLGPVLAMGRAVRSAVVVRVGLLLLLVGLLWVWVRMGE